MVSLLEVLRDRGYQFRQHLPEEGWGARKLVVVDLDDAQQAALQADGMAGLLKQMEAQGQWTFPAMDVTRPLERAADVPVVIAGKTHACIVAPDTEPWQIFARQLADSLARHGGQPVPVVVDSTDLDAILTDGSAIILGGSDENRVARQLSLRYRTGFVDASVPGEGGWLVTTHTGLNTAGHNVLQIAGSADQHAAAMAHVESLVTHNGGDTIIRHAHHVVHGHALKARFTSWEKFADYLPTHILQLTDTPIESVTDPVALSHLLAKGLHCGGPEANIYNAAPLDLTILAARYYQISADQRGLILFREMLFRLADYFLVTPEGASYIADNDFRIGTLLNYYARFEHLPVFSDEDRLILVNLMLACFRSVHEYTNLIWPIDPNIRKRFNHQTFKAMNLEFAADYFDRYGIADTTAWRAYPASVFTDDVWSRWKHKENAGTYEVFVHGHAAAWLTFRGQSLEAEHIDCMKKIVHRQMATTDNFHRPVDYGDAGLLMQPVCAGMARVVAMNDPDPQIAWFAEQDLIRGGDDLPSFLFDHPGLHRTPPQQPPKSGMWEYIPLDPAFTQDYAPEIDPKLAFDKLAYRSGWNDRDQYMLWEGVGNLVVGHSHNEVNGIVRYNDRGRHWLVSNGYGRRAGITNVSESYSTRVRGPEDHNTLVLKREGKTVVDLPACATLLQRGSKADLSWATAAVSNYAGIDWRRTAVIARNAFLLIIDRIQVNKPGLEQAHIEWNALGDSSAIADGYRVEQQGEFMHLTSNSSWPAHREDADRSACWKKMLGTKEYPYAQFPVNKFVYQMPDCSPGKMQTLVTLVVTSGSVEAPYKLQSTAAGSVSVIGKFPDTLCMQASDGNLTLQCSSNSCDIQFDASCK